MFFVLFFFSGVCVCVCEKYNEMMMMICKDNHYYDAPTMITKEKKKNN